VIVRPQIAARRCPTAPAMEDLKSFEMCTVKKKINEVKRVKKMIVFDREYLNSSTQYAV
jgi:hypothetical protein